MCTAVSTPPAFSAQPIQVEKFVKRFGATTAVNGVSLALHPGDCLGLLGPNGAGKTTLIRGIVGRVLPHHGRICIFGADAGSKAARQVLGWVPQELVDTQSVVGEHKNENLISFYAAAIGVMFLLFTATGAAGSLLDEADSGTLDRVLSSRVTMTTLLAGKLTFNTLLAFLQLVVMFLWGWAVFHLDFFTHIPGFVVMGLCTAFAVAAFGILLASMCHTRGQLGAVSTLLILIMSAVGGSMFPRFLMPEAIQKAGLFTINAWAIDGFTKVFWRDLPLTSLWPQVGVLLCVGIVLFIVARRWEFA